MASRYCWKCKTKTHMTIIRESARRWKLLREYGGSHEPAIDVLCAMYMCDECNAPSIGSGVRDNGSSSDYAGWLEGRREEDGPEIQWIPEAGIGKDFPDVPEHIASAASEAYSCHSIGAHRAAGGMARAVVEATAKEKGIDRGRLVDKIEKLFDEGLIRADVKDAAHEVRHLGNDMAHGDFVDPVTSEEIAEVLELMSEILDEVFQTPARIARRRTDRLAKAASNSEMAT
jgi:hypothetical protein